MNFNPDGMPKAPPLTEQDEHPAPTQRTPLLDLIFLKWHRKERLIIAGVLLAIWAVSYLAR